VKYLGVTMRLISDSYQGLLRGEYRYQGHGSWGPGDR